jgi:hypothetical protein
MENMRKLLCYLSAITLSLIINQTSLVNSEGKQQTGNDPKEDYFKMDSDSERAFFEKLKLLRIGDSIEKVKATLGEPRHDQKLLRKKGEFVARALEYYTRILEKDLAHEKHDKYVLLLFDAENRLKHIKSNIEGVGEEFRR